jgi:hypothetical protein
MNSLGVELKAVIARHVASADQEQILAIASVLSAFADEPRREILASLAGARFEILDDEQVLDHELGLIWTRKDAADRTMTFKDAETHCAKLELAAARGWRLPTVRELLSLVNYERHNPSIDTSVFTDCKTGWYWTSTPWAESPSVYAWVVLFNNGNSYCLHRGSNGFVRAVRASQ